MKRLFLSAALAAVMMLSGCAGMKIHRGLDASGAFVSSASPAVTVQASEGFTAVASGRTLCSVPAEAGITTADTADVWYSLYKSDSAQIAVMLAECSGPNVWNISATGVEYQVKPLLYKFYGQMPGDATVLVYTRKVEKDPWMPIFAQAGSAWEGETLLARYEWMDSSSTEKLVAEYREPAPALEEGFVYSASDVNSFIARSQKAFKLAGVQEGAQVAPAPQTNIPNAVLAPVVGSIVQPEPMDFDVD
ncbi:MAG: DUF4851 domain-containing protein [Mailhella sp.]|nr:DUF4851 domain-containing protein [Mailhella sp.]MBR5882766.1 DUF4851 domain-containing protein [Mailhella sp.]